MVRSIHYDSQPVRGDRVGRSYNVGPVVIVHHSTHSRVVDRTGLLCSMSIHSAVSLHVRNVCVIDQAYEADQRQQSAHTLSLRLELLFRFI